MAAGFVEARAEGGRRPTHPRLAPRARGPRAAQLAALPPIAQPRPIAAIHRLSPAAAFAREGAIRPFRPRFGRRVGIAPPSAATLRQNRTGAAGGRGGEIGRRGGGIGRRRKGSGNRSFARRIRGAQAARRRGIGGPLRPLPVGGERRGLRKRGGNGRRGLFGAGKPGRFRPAQIAGRRIRFGAAGCAGAPAEGRRGRPRARSDQAVVDFRSGLIRAQAPCAVRFLSLFTRRGASGAVGARPRIRPARLFRAFPLLRPNRARLSLGAGGRAEAGCGRRIYGGIAGGDGGGFRSRSLKRRILL